MIELASKIYGMIHTMRIFNGDVPESADDETTQVPLATLDLSNYNPPRYEFE